MRHCGDRACEHEIEWIRGTAVPCTTRKDKEKDEKARGSAPATPASFPSQGRKSRKGNSLDEMKTFFNKSLTSQALSWIAVSRDQEFKPRSDSVIPLPKLTRLIHLSFSRPQPRPSILILRLFFGRRPIPGAFRGGRRKKQVFFLFLFSRPYDAFRFGSGVFSCQTSPLCIIASITRAR